MSFNINEIVEQNSKETYYLQPTKNLKKTNKSNTLYQRLRREYDLNQDNNNPFVKLIISIYNSVISNRRCVFILSRDNIFDVVRHDSNWKNFSIDQGLWKRAVAELTKVNKTTNRPFIKVIGQIANCYGTHTKICEITDPEIIKELQVDIQEQREEVFYYLESRKTTKKNTSTATTITKDRYDQIVNFFKIKNSEMYSKHKGDAPPLVVDLLFDPITKAMKEDKEFNYEVMFDKLKNALSKMFTGEIGERLINTYEPLLNDRKNKFEKTILPSIKRYYEPLNKGDTVERGIDIILNDGFIDYVSRSDGIYIVKHKEGNTFIYIGEKFNDLADYKSTMDTLNEIDS